MAKNMPEPEPRKFNTVKVKLKNLKKIEAGGTSTKKQKQSHWDDELFNTANLYDSNEPNPTTKPPYKDTNM